MTIGAFFLLSGYHSSPQRDEPRKINISVVLGAIGLGASFYCFSADIFSLDLFLASAVLSVAIAAYLLKIQRSSTVIKNVKSPLKGLSSIRELELSQFQLFPWGTPGVDLAGTCKRDRDLVRQRINMVRKYVLPQAHTVESWRKFREYSQIIALESLTGEGERLGLQHIFKVHNANRDLMIRNLGKQIEVHIIGGGPIGLAGVLLWYQLGARVVLHERFLETSCTKRQQPFSLQPAVYRYIAGLGLSQEEMLRAYGLTEAEIANEAERTGSRYAAGFHLTAAPLMKKTRSERIGVHCADFLPSQMSLSIGIMQELLLGVIKKILERDPREIQLLFAHECTQSFIEEGTGRTGLEFRGGEQVIPDVIYNCSGGRINEILKFKKIRVAQMYGMGAFFPVPETRLPVPSKPPRLSRCVRLFVTKISPWIYGNFELSKEESVHKEAMENILDIFCEQTGIAKARNYFPVKVDLSYAASVMTVHRAGSSFSEGLQLIINGGDAAIKPDFRTASGANIGLMGQIYLQRLIKQLINGGDIGSFQEEYEKIHSVLRKQICQIVVDLFGRSLISR